MKFYRKDQDQLNTSWDCLAWKQHALHGCISIHPKFNHVQQVRFFITKHMIFVFLLTCVV